MRYTEYPYRIIVLNNDGGSEKGREVVDNLLGRFGFDKLEAVHLKANLGWMGALNVGLDKVESPYLCCMNDDVVFIPWDMGFWRRLMHSFRRDNVGAVGPCSNFVMGRQNLNAHDVPPSFISNYLIGFCMAARTQVIKDIDGWDEELPGGDDLDISIRIRQAGYKMVVNRAAYLHHIGQQTGPRAGRADWNSQDHQEATNNALIRKHGVRAWYETYSGGVSDIREMLPSMDDEQNHIQAWLRRFDGGKGLNLGSGHRDLGSGLNIDIARPGETGAGGRKLEGATPDITADALDLPVADHSLDYITAVHLFEHLLDPLEVLEEWKRALKPEGRLLLVCPDHDRQNTVVMDYSHVHAFTAQSLARLLKAAGWHVVHAQLHQSGAMSIEVSPVPVAVVQEVAEEVEVVA